MQAIAIAELSLAPLLAQSVTPTALSGWDRLGIAAILVAVIVTAGYLLLSRKIVLGSTCDLLLDNERKRTEAAEAEARAAREDLSRIADEFNANFALVVRELTRRTPGAGDHPDGG